MGKHQIRRVGRALNRRMLQLEDGSLRPEDLFDKIVADLEGILQDPLDNEPTAFLDAVYFGKDIAT